MICTLMTINIAQMSHDMTSMGKCFWPETASVFCLVSNYTIMFWMPVWKHGYKSLKSHSGYTRLWVQSQFSPQSWIRAATCFLSQLWIWPINTKYRHIWKKALGSNTSFSGMPMRGSGFLFVLRDRFHSLPLQAAKFPWKLSSPSPCCLFCHFTLPVQLNGAKEEQLCWGQEAIN